MLSSELRDELAAIAPARRCCRLAELSALFHVAGAWHLRGRGELAVHLDLATSAVARRGFALLRELGVRSELRTYRRRSFDRATRYQLHVDADAAALEILREAGVVSAAGAPLERPPKRVVGRSCCRGAYLRGALLGGGSLSGPRSPHLELRASGLAGAQFIADVAAQEKIPLAVTERRTHAIATLPPRLQEIAELRVRHPSVPLSELARKCRPPITKAAAHARLRAIFDRADD
jgi:DNA-binding protein WhiA